MMILWINIIMDGPLAQSLGVESVDTTVMQRPPRNRQEDIITKPLLLRVFTSGLLILLGTMYIFITEMESVSVDAAITTSEHISPRDLTMTFTTFIMFDMFNALACRHNTKTIFEIGLLSNHSFLAAMSFSIGGQFCLIYFPFLQKIFKTVPLGISDLAFITTLCSTMLVLDTIRKKYFSHVFTEIMPNSYQDKVSIKKIERGENFMV